MCERVTETPTPSAPPMDRAYYEQEVVATAMARGHELIEQDAKIGQKMKRGVVLLASTPVLITVGVWLMTWALQQPAKDLDFCILGGLMVGSFLTSASIPTLPLGICEIWESNVEHRQLVEAAFAKVGPVVDFIKPEEGNHD